VLWDEAQDSPALLRFLAPFGRPDLGRISRRFLSSNSVSDLVSEGYPAFATWLATMVLRDGAAVNETFDALPTPQWDNSMMHGGLVLGAPLELGSTRINTLVIAGSLEAPSVRVHAKTLVVAGDLKTKLLVADGCVLVGGAVEADAVLVPASHLSRERDQFAPPRSLGLQVGREVVCRVSTAPASRSRAPCALKSSCAAWGSR
jgi:hypothetical protein